MRLSRTLLLVLFTYSLLGFLSFADSPNYLKRIFNPIDSTQKDSTKIKSGKRPINTNKQKPIGVFRSPKTGSPLIISDKSKIQSSFKLNESNNIEVTEKISEDSTNKSNLLFKPLDLIPLQDFKTIERKKIVSEIWKQNSKKYDGQSEIGGRGLNPKLLLGDSFDKLFGGGGAVEFKANGNVLLDFGALFQNIDNPAIPIRQRKTGNFNFNEQAQINFTGKIGENMNLNANFDTKASFNFENKLKLNYRAKEEDIIQKVEAGNINFQVPSQLIPGVQNLFGVKTLLRFGKLDATLVFANQRSKQQRMVIRGGSQNKGYEIRADQYEENKHFFLSQYFRKNYEKSLKNLPMITSGINITRLEVYVTNRTNTTDALRNILGVTDIGEGNPYNKSVPSINPIITSSPADNNANGLFKSIYNNSSLRQVDRTSDIMSQTLGLQRGQDFELLRGAKRLLNDREYRFHEQLGYISLFTPLRNDEVLAVAYEYTLNGRQYKVGELTEDYQARDDDQVLVLKMLKSSTIRNNVNLPMWDLMMKNVYSLNSSNLNKIGFQLRIIYKDDQTGLDNPNLQEGRRLKDVPLLQVFGLDKLNQMGDPQVDGNFDFIENTTVDVKNGKIIFPVLEPFGKTLNGYFDTDESALAQKYVFEQLYRSTQIEATQITEKNKFFIRGTSQSSMGGEVQLPFGVDPQSVRVSAGGSPLTKGIDYEVDSNGRVKVTNGGVSNSQQDIYIDYEQPDLFNNQIRTFGGARFDYTISKDFRLGASAMKYKETPPANLRRVAIGNEPTNNAIIGFDMAYRKESKAITRFLDKLPLISTKETSLIDFQGEYAKLIPGVASRTQDNSFLDDFEGSRTVYDLTRQSVLWRLGATPITFNQSNAIEPLRYGYKRAKVSVYTVDNTFYGLGGNFANAPTNLTDIDLTNHYEKQVSPQSIFPNKAINNGFVIPVGLMDVYYNPNERGPYNYNADLLPNGYLKNPKQNFGAVTRAMTSDPDFDNANIETVEFWLLDPFINNSRGVVRATGDANLDKSNTTGGTLMLNLGDVSEDIIPDGRYNYENGLPLVDIISKGTQRNVDSTYWGYAPRSQFVTKAFSNQPGAREKQDVGLDGLSNVQENAFFKGFIDKLPSNMSPDAKAAIIADPSADDFEFYFSEKANQSNKKIVQRYKNYMGYENNTPELNRQADISETNSYLPDVEDLNTDNTVNDNEAYYQYKLDLKPGALEVGKGYIVDKVTTDGADWYLFRVPIKNYTDKVGSINGFKSIRFMRMFMTDFEQPVVLRFAQFQITGYQYRKYTNDLNKKSLNEVPEPYDAQFRVATVSIEENGATDKNGTKVTPYVVPPGFERDRDLTTINNAELNEQSMSLSVVNLRNGDSRAVFKNVNFDMQFNKRLKMFVHMENEKNESNQVSSFVRLGTDLTDNYYEIEIKGLKATNPNEVNPQTPEPEKVWPFENEFDVSLDDLRRAKSERDKTGGYLSSPFQIETEDKRFWIRVVGRPDLSAVMTLMIGVRNPKQEGGFSNEEPKSFSIWVNELRTNGYDQSSGYAAIGKLNLKLADLGSVTVTGSIKTFGFGSVMDKISQRERSTTSDINLQGSLQLDKFTKEKWGLRIPMYFNLGRSNISPNFNPLDPDMPLETTLASTNDPAKRELLKQIAEDNTTRKGINFTNVKKVKTGTNTKNHAYDVENLSVSYSYSEVERTSPMIASYKQSSEKGAITYAYQPESKSIEPFKNSQIPLVRDINLSPIPNSVAVSLDMDRSFVKTQMRNSDLTSKDVSPFFEKYWLMNRRYDVGWNLTKSIVLNYNALSNAIIDEPRGDIDTQAKQDSVKASLRRFGRTKGFDQRISGTYRIPFDKSKLLDWLSADYNYRSGYLFAANSYDIKDEQNVNFGNIIKNNREQIIAGRVDFVKLYNKVRYLKFANSPTPQRKNFTRNPGDFDELPPAPNVVAKSIARALMALRGIQYSYTLSETTILPGFLPNVQFGGMNQRLENAPGLAFTLGSQDPNIRFVAAEKGWLSRSLELNIPFVQTRTTRLDFRASIEPIKDFKIQLAANFSRSDNYSEFYRPRHADSAFVSQSPVRGGNFSMSFFSFGSSFDKNTKDNASPSFQRFSDYRKTIQDRITKDNPEKIGKYNDKSQDVLIPAFFAAYAKRDPEKVSFSPFYNIPFPNWNVDYSGLVNSFPALKKNFSSINIKHNFTSIYSVGNFTSSLLYDQQYISFDSPLYPFAVISNAEGQYVPVYVMSVISMVEKFSPLIGIQVRTKDNSTFALEYNQERNVSLNLSNTSLADLTNRGLVIRYGTVKNNFRLPFKIGGQSVTLKNDLRFDVNLTINDTRAILRKLDGETVPTSGNYNFQFSPKIIYKVNKKLDVTMYFDRTVNDPLVTNSFRRATTAFGFKVRFDLSQ